MSDSNKEIYGYLTFSRELGYHLLRNGKCTKEALSAFDNAIDKNSDDKRTINGHVKTLITMLKFSDALKDIEHLSKPEDNRLFLLNLKSYCTMLSGDFEDALVLNCTGAVQRRKPDVFHVGTKQCADIIEDCIGERAGNPFRDNFELIFDKNVKSDKVNSKFVNEISAEIYLGRFYQDLIFLKNLKMNHSLTSKFFRNNDKILQLIDQCIKNITVFQETLRKMKPYYSFKNQSYKISEKLKTRQKSELLSIHSVIVKEVHGFFRELLEAKDALNISLCHEIAMNTKVFIDSKPKRILSEKVFLLRELYDLFANSILSMFSLTDNNMINENRILVMLGFAADNELKNDPLIQSYKNLKLTVNNYKNMVLILENTLKNTKIMSEKIWCCYHLSHCYFEKKQFSLAQLFGKKCLMLGKKILQKNWMIIGCSLQARALVQRQNSQAANALILEATGYAKTLKKEILVEFLKKCMDIIQRLDFVEKIRKCESDREKEIVKLVRNSVLRQDFELLFKHIKSVAPNHRLKLKSGLNTSNFYNRGSRKSSRLKKKKISNGIIARRQSRVLKEFKQ